MAVRRSFFFICKSSLRGLRSRTFHCRSHGRFIAGADVTRISFSLFNGADGADAGACAAARAALGIDDVYVRSLGNHLHRTLRLTGAAAYAIRCYLVYHSSPRFTFLAFNIDIVGATERQPLLSIGRTAASTSVRRVSARRATTQRGAHTLCAMLNGRIEARTEASGDIQWPPDASGTRRRINAPFQESELSMAFFASSAVTAPMRLFIER